MVNLFGGYKLGVKLLHLEGVIHDVPESYNDYVHRIGRTGRIGKKGVALTFVD